MFLLILAVVVFACMNRRYSHRRGYWARGGHDGRSRAGTRTDRPSVKERFDEWHRTAHGDDRGDAPAPDPDDTRRV